MGCSRISLAVRRPKAVTRANFSRSDQRASLSFAVRGSMLASGWEGGGGVVVGVGEERERRSVGVGSMR